MKLLAVAAVIGMTCVSVGGSADVLKPTRERWMPTASEFFLMKKNDQIELIVAIKEFHAKVGMRQPPNYGEFQFQPNLPWIVFGSDIAEAYSVGDDCVIAGYLSKFKSGNKKGWVTCPVPDAKEWPAYEKNSDFGCKPPKTILCNPAIFGFPSAKDGSGCQTVASSGGQKTLTERCDENGLAPEKVVEQLLKELAKEPLESTPEWKVVEASLKKINEHCKETTAAAKTYNRSECAALRARADKIQSGYNLGKAKIEGEKANGVVISNCAISGSSKWARVEVKVKGGKEYFVTAVPSKVGDTAREQKIEKPVSPLELKGQNGQPDLTITSSDAFKTCEISEKATVAAQPPKPPYDACAAGAGEGWSEMCSFVDERSICKMEESQKLDFGGSLRQIDSRGFGPQGFYGGKPEIGKLIQQGLVKASVPESARLNELLESDIVSTGANATSVRASDFSPLMKEVTDNCELKNSNVRKGKEKKGEKPSSDYRVVRIENVNSIMYTCQKFDKDFEKNLKANKLHDSLEFAESHAVVVHKGAKMSGLVESGAINGQGDFRTSDIYKPGFYKVVATRHLDTKENQPKQSDEDKKLRARPIRYVIGNVDLCPDSVEKTNVALAAGSRPYNRIYKNGSQYKICDSEKADGKYEGAKGLAISSDGKKVLKPEAGSDTAEFVISIDEKDSKKCGLSYNGLAVPTSAVKIGSGAPANPKAPGL